MRGAIPSLPNTPSWRGAQLKKSPGTTLLLPYLSGLVWMSCWRDDAWII